MFATLELNPKCEEKGEIVAVFIDLKSIVVFYFVLIVINYILFLVHSKNICVCSKSHMRIRNICY